MYRKRAVIRYVLPILLTVAAVLFGVTPRASGEILDPILSIQANSGGPASNILNSGSPYSLLAVLNGTQSLAVTNPTASFAYLITNDTGAALTDLTLGFTGTADSKAVWQCGKPGTYDFTCSVSPTSGLPPVTWVFSGMNIPDTGQQFLVWFQSFEVPNASGSVSPPGTPSTVPEPATLALLGTGLLSVAGVIRRRFKRSSE